MTTPESIKVKLLNIIQKINDATHFQDKTVNDAVDRAIGLLNIHMADDVLFTPEPLETDVLYAIGYNWFAQLVALTQKLSYTNQNMTPNMILDTLSKIGYYPKIEISQDITPIHVRTQTKLNNFQEVKIEPRIEEPQVEAITEAYNNFSTSLKMSFANIKDIVPQDFIVRQEEIN